MERGDIYCRSQFLITRRREGGRTLRQHSKQARLQLPLRKPVESWNYRWDQYDFRAILDLTPPPPKYRKFGHKSLSSCGAPDTRNSGDGNKGVARIWFRGGAPISGGGDPLFFASDPKSQGSPLMYFWLPPDFGGGAGPPRPPWLRPWMGTSS